MQQSPNPKLSSLSACQVLIVEDEYIIANDLELILHEAGYSVLGVAESVAEALTLIARQTPDMVLLDIYLKGKETGIDLAKQLEDKAIPFIYISANDNKSVLEAVKATQPSGYIVKPFREKDILTTLEISRYRHAHSVEMRLREEKALQIDLTEALSEPGGWEKKLLNAAMLLQPHVPFDFLIVQYRKNDSKYCYNFYRVGFEEYQTLSLTDLQPMTGVPVDQLLAMQNGMARQGAVRYNEDDFDTFCKTNPYGQVIARSFRGISGRALNELINYTWPGNIRELENVMEQAVIINDGHSTLELGRPLLGNLFMVNSPPATSEASTQGLTYPRASHPKDLHDVKQIQQQTEREYILDVLKRTNGRIRGNGGAAELLNLKPTTLEYRMEKLGIRKTLSIEPAIPSTDK
jgi:DNA-binding NtrC family response regulator